MKLLALNILSLTFIKEFNFEFQCFGRMFGKNKAYYEYSLFSASLLGLSSRPLFSASLLGLSSRPLFSASLLGLSSRPLFSASLLGLSSRPLFSASLLGLSSRPLFSASLLGLLLIFLAAPKMVHAQDAWIELSPIALDSENLTESESAYLSLLSELPYLSMPIVQTVVQENVSSAEAVKVIKLALPGFEGVTTLPILEHNIKELGESSIDVLTGNEIHSLIVGGGDPCIGHYFMSVDNGSINGRVNTALGDFLVRALSDSKVVVFVASSAMSTGCEECEGVQEGEGGHSHSTKECSSEEVVSPIAKDNSLPNLSSTFQSERRCRIDFVAAVTPNAASNPGWAKSDALSTELDMNLAIRNSGIENLSYRLVGFKELSTFSFANGSIPAATLTIASANQEILNIYSDYGADVVLLFYQNGGLLGNRGWSEIGSAAPQDRDLSLAEINLTFQFTGVHELGHNHGCKHRIDATVGTIGQLVLTARGHRIDPNDPDDDDIIVERTIMAINARDRSEGQQVDGKRVLRFSNPSVLWYDWIRDTSFPTGTAANNNAAQMSVYGCTLADLRDPLVEGITLSGPLRSTPGGIISVHSDRRCNGGVTPVVTYEASVDGGPFTVFGTGGSSISFNVPSSTVNYVQFRATITCSPGNSYSDIHTVTIREPCEPSALFGGAPSDVNRFPISEVETQFVSSKETLIIISWGEHDGGALQVSDFLGRVLWQGKIGRDEDRSQFNIEGINQGDIVIVSFSDGEKLASKKIYVK